MKTIIAGSRGLDCPNELASVLASLGWKITEVVSGGCRGIDQLGEAWARERGIPVKVFPADWDRHGRAAGPIRNQQMAEYADALVAFWDGRSRGTEHMMACAKARKLHWHIHLTYPGPNSPLPPYR